MRNLAALAVLALAGCAPRVAVAPPPPPPPLLAPVEIQILAFNDFHGNLETPAPVEVVDPDGSKRTITTGGVAHLSALLTKLRSGHANTVTVSAGDTIGATPLISAYYLDEPAIAAISTLGLEYNSVGNHEFDKGSSELKRMQSGGCEAFTRRTPCAIEPFTGARFKYLAANVFEADGTTIFPATAIKDFGPIKIGFIGMTLKDTATLVTPSGVRGLTFADEASTANALVPKLRAEGADAIVLLIHQGGRTPTFTTGNGCKELDGGILPIIGKLDPAIQTIVSGHTHWAYVCKNGEGGTSDGRLLTSAGKNGYFVTDLRLRFDPSTRKLISQDATNVVTGNGENGEDAAEKALVDRYATAIAPVRNRIVGHLTAPAPNDVNDWESPAADMIADATLAATKAPEMGGAQIAFVNATGVRVPLPAGDITYAQAFSVMPFGNNLVVMTLTGADIKAAIEQQFDGPIRDEGFPAVLAASMGFRYSIDMNRPSGDRVTAMSLNGKPIKPDARYRVALNNYLASGGDGISAFTAGTDLTDKGVIDLDALIAWIAKGREPPKPNRISAKL